MRCGTLKEAELIPDSAVPYTLPESRCKSSNRQTSKGLRERYRRTGEVPTCVCVRRGRACVRARISRSSQRRVSGAH